MKLLFIVTSLTESLNELKTVAMELTPGFKDDNLALKAAKPGLVKFSGILELRFELDAPAADILQLGKKFIVSINPVIK